MNGTRRQHRVVERSMGISTVTPRFEMPFNAALFSRQMLTNILRTPSVPIQCKVK